MEKSPTANSVVLITVLSNPRNLCFIPHLEHAWRGTQRLGNRLKAYLDSPDISSVKNETFKNNVSCSSCFWSSQKFCRDCCSHDILALPLQDMARIWTCRGMRKLKLTEKFQIRTTTKVKGAHLTGLKLTGTLNMWAQFS